MNTSLPWTAVGVVAALAAWQAWGYFSSRVEQAAYTVMERRDGYEIRRYPAHIVAQTTVQGPYREALNEGFRIVAAYIFGANASRSSIAMTAPVTETEAGETIAMTAPVTETPAGDAHTIAFGMPASQTLATLPRPTDPRVRIVELPERKMAVMRFSWWASTGRIEAMKARLRDALTRDKVEVVGAASYAGYNAPWTPPWSRRHEVLVPVR
jgi:hypothetical protein